MNQPNLSGFLLIGGFVLVLLASIASPPRLYQEPDSGQRLQSIEDHQTRWITSNLLFGLAGLATAAGLILFSIYLQNEVSPWLNWLAALTYALGTTAWIIFLVQRAIDPAQLFEDYTFSPFTIALLGLLLCGLLLYGILYLQAGYPGWLGFGTAGLTVLIGLLAIVFPDRFFASFPPQALYLFTLAAGIVFLRG